MNEIIKTQFGQCYRDCKRANKGDFSCPQKRFVRIKNGECLDIEPLPVKETNNYKYKNLNDALIDAIGSAISDNDTFYEDPAAGTSSDNYLPAKRYDDVIKEAIKNIMEIKGLVIKYEKEVDKMKELLEDIRHELVTLNNLYATDKEITPSLDKNLFFKTNTSETIKRIDKCLEENNDK